MGESKALILQSGGIDSMCCAHLLKTQGYAVSGMFIDYGQPASEFERVAAQRISTNLKIPLSIVSISGQSSLGAGEIRGRNLLLVSAALTYVPIERGLDETPMAQPVFM